MSVEEAREAVIHAMFSVDQVDADAGLIDLLILEVQAAMPCYYNWDIGGYPAQTCPNAQLDTFCGPCTARADLAKRKVAV